DKDPHSLMQDLLADLDDEPSAYFFGGLAAQPPSPIRIAQQRLDGVRQSQRIALGHEYRIPCVFNDFAYRSSVGAYDGKPGGHPFEQRGGNAIFVAEFGLDKRSHKQMGALEERLDAGFRHPSLEMHDGVEFEVIDPFP